MFWLWSLPKETWAILWNYYNRKLEYIYALPPAYSYPAIAWQHTTLMGLCSGRKGTDMQNKVSIAVITNHITNKPTTSQADGQPFHHHRLPEKPSTIVSDGIVRLREIYKFNIPIQLKILFSNYDLECYLL